MRPVLSGLIVESEQLNALSAGALPRTLHFGTDGRNAICTLRKLIKVTRKPIGAFIGEAPLAPLASDGRVALNLAAFDTEQVVAGRGSSRTIAASRILPVVPICRGHFACAVGQITGLSSPVSRPKRGAYRDRHGRWARDAMDALGARDER
jgi:hypothetical protein